MNSFWRLVARVVDPVGQRAHEERLAAQKLEVERMERRTAEIIRQTELEKARNAVRLESMKATTQKLEVALKTNDLAGLQAVIQDIKASAIPDCRACGAERMGHAFYDNYLPEDPDRPGFDTSGRCMSCGMC